MYQIVKEKNNWYVILIPSAQNAIQIQFPT